MKYERQIKRVDDSADMQEQLRGHHDYRLAAAIPWGDVTYLVFEREKFEESPLLRNYNNDSPF